jgi:glycerol-3-phosphate acyltransferase PlsY
MFYSILILIVGLLIGYFVGSLSFSLIIGLNFYQKDVRLYGSKNAGGTNATRVLGKKAGFLVMFFDVLKTIVVYWTVLLLMRIPSIAMYAWVAPTLYGAVIATALGHAFPVWYGFKGGKVVSIFAGFCLATSWLFSLVGMALFFTLIFTKKIVSLASISTAIATILYGWIVLFPNVANIMLWGAADKSAIWLYVSFVIIAIMLVWRHKENIKRLLNGTERKIGQKVQ